MRDDLYSYWLTVRHTDDKPFAPQDARALADSLSARLDGNLVYALPEPDDDMRVIRMQVPEDVGSVYYLPDAFDIVKAWASGHPDCVVDLEELNEDDHAEQRYAVFLGDETLRDTHARLVDADADYDWPTVDSVAEFVALTIPGPEGAVLAQRIRSYYKPHCSDT